MHASTDPRLIKSLDGIHYSFQILSELHEQLHPACVAIKEDQRALVGALWRCWSFVDMVHRLRELAQGIPGLRGTNRDLKDFLSATALGERYRHYIQHLRSELSRRDLHPFPVWGSLAWIDAHDPTISYLILAGASVGETSYSGCVFDTLNRCWVSKVCLGIEGLSFNFDPIFEACRKFHEFIIPWILSRYEPEIKQVSQPSILTMQIVIHGKSNV